MPRSTSPPPLPIEKLYIDLPGFPPGSLNAYLLTASIALVAVALRAVIDPYVSGIQFITFFPAVMIATLLCGLRAGLFATALCGLSAFYFILPLRELSAADGGHNVGALILYFCFASAGALAMGALRMATLHIRSLNASLEERVGERTRELEDANRRLRTEIAERKEAERERDRLVETSLDLMCVIGAEGRFRNVNPAFERILGWSRDELLSRPFIEFGHPDDIGAVRGEAARLAKGGGPATHFQSRFRCRDGSYRWFSWNCTPFPKDGVFYGVARDVTASREAEAKLRETQAALQQAQKMEALGRLTGGIAHDFNNLLTPVLGGLELLGRRVQTDGERKLINGAIQAAERGAKLTEQLLAFSRKQRLSPRPVDLNRIIEGMQDLLARTLGGLVRVDTHVAEGLWLALVDPTQIEMVVLNLAINARDAMPLGGTLSIGTMNARLGSADRPKDLPPGDYVLLSIADTGTGMCEEVRTRAFEPFFTTKEVGKGSGLGLSQVHGIVTQSSGAVEIRSTPGEGTIVRVYLPRTTEAAEIDTPSAEGGLSANRRARILLVEDDANVRAFAAFYLRSLNYEVAEAEDARKGLRLIDVDPNIDLLLADYAMPNMSGSVLAREARSRRPGLPVLLVTGYADAVLSEADASIPVLRKPFSPADLASHVVAALTAKPAEERTNVFPLRRTTY